MKVKTVILSMAFCCTQYAFSFNWHKTKAEDLDVRTYLDFYTAKDAPPCQRYLGKSSSYLLFFGSVEGKVCASIFPYHTTQLMGQSFYNKDQMVEVTDVVAAKNLTINLTSSPTGNSKDYIYAKSGGNLSKVKSLADQALENVKTSHLRTLKIENLSSFEAFKEYLSAWSFMYKNVEPEQRIYDLLEDESSMWSIFPLPVHPLMVDYTLGFLKSSKEMATDKSHSLSIDDAISDAVLPKNSFWLDSDKEAVAKLKAMEKHGSLNFPFLYSFSPQVKGFSAKFPKLAKAAKQYIRYEITARTNWYCEGEYSFYANYYWVLKDGSLFHYEQTPECD